MEFVDLHASDGMWYTKEPSSKWSRIFLKNVRVPKSRISQFTEVTEEFKSKYEKDRNEYYSQLNSEED